MDKQITVFISGGCVQGVTGIPEGVSVRIIDYDCDGARNVDTDDEGESCIIAIYTEGDN